MTSLSVLAFTVCIIFDTVLLFTVSFRISSASFIFVTFLLLMEKRMLD